MVSYANLIKDTFVEIRNILRADTTLLTPLEIIEPENHIFAFRPTDQVKGFKNPRIVIEDPLHLAGDMGGNEDGYHEDTLTFLINGWTDEDPYGLAIDAAERIRVLLHRRDLSLDEGGKLTLKVDNVNVVPDADKERTNQLQIAMSAKIITRG